MANLTIYLSAEVEEKVRKAAKTERVSMSRWIASRITQIVDESWPPEFLRAAGSLSDFPEAEDLRKGYGTDSPREKWD